MDDTLIYYRSLFAAGRTQWGKTRFEVMLKSVLPVFNIDHFKSAFRVSRTLLEELVICCSILAKPFLYAGTILKMISENFK